MSIDDVLREELTPEQYAAAVDPTNEVLCLACAGSGKSRTLAYRIARLVAEGEPPEGIVAFTFTEKAAETIKRRVSQALAAAGLDPAIIGVISIGTIHSYCQHILGEMDADYRQFDVLDENRLKLFLISRFRQLGIGGFLGRANRRYFETIRQVSDAWKITNDELLDPDAIRDEDPELGELLSRIRDNLYSSKYIDFSLMIRNVVDAVQDIAPGVDSALGQLRHLMVDEYQDVNPAQEALIRLLHRRSQTLFVVGDDDQAIYAWRGADVVNILEFEHRYPGCAVHTLAQNFRSTEPIVQASDAFAAAVLGPSRIEKNPSAVANLFPQDFRVLWFPDKAAEAECVVERIIALLGTAYEEDDGIRGLTPADFAILMRSTRQPEQDGTPRHLAFTSELERLGIPFSLEAGGGPFDRIQTQVLRSTFELLRDGSPNRNTVRQHFTESVLPAYPNANFNSLVRVLTEWGQRIHRPRGSTRIRLYPQQLVYDLLEAFNLAETHFSEDIMRDIGLFSTMILDVETVYMSIDSRQRFAEILNFLQNAAETGYDVATDDVLRRPDAVAVATVHKMKGLEFPCVFLVDVEAQRFPKRRSEYRGWLPLVVMADSVRRGAYQTTHNEEARLFYTATTRAERYLYVSGSEQLPAGRNTRRPSPYALELATHPQASEEIEGLPPGIAAAAPRRRVEETDYPTNFTEIKYYLQCPRGFQFRQRFGLNPMVPELFGYGRSVHTSIQKLHELFPNVSPELDRVEQVVTDTFHLKHVPESADPVERPGAYENARTRAVEMVQEYVSDYGGDFERERQVEAVFEIPVANCLISGSIDLLLHEDTRGRILEAEIIDFKTIEGGEEPATAAKLDWTELALQVQLYARAADQILGQNARTGSVHLLKDNQRVEVPITREAVEAAVANIEWAAEGILSSDFPMRPHHEKCAECDFIKICSHVPEPFSSLDTEPPELYLPGRREMVRAFSLFEGT